MFTLSTFYNSKEWERFRIPLINSRLNDAEETICEHCGKPISRAYDIILHHVIELTEDNVNDYMISLNPDNIKIVHHKCHNIIHRKLSYANKKIYIVYGSPMSGKTSYVKECKDKGDLIVDMDSIWECVSGDNRYSKDGRLNACVFAVRDTLLDCIKYRRGKWLNAYIIGGYPLISERERLCRELGAELIFIDTPKEECIKRLYKSDDGRDIKEWEKFIEDWWRKYSPLSA